MGVPKFFRYISERYPCLNEKLREYQIPEFDNLYLDMNGIIHVCSHPDDNPLVTVPEELIFKNIFFYIELMFRLIQPKKLFLMAVDGVAPRAKMNQQRGRRFRAAKDAEVAAARAEGTGLPVPSDDRFDSNCITPGTEFMDRLHQQLKYFIAYKISTDKIWRRPKIILSGHDTPGEGEHKIMDYIRYLRSKDDWDPNTRHCLHGLDADLIMLGLCSHELHFSLLREEVKFGRNQKRPANPEEIQFFLLHLSMLRDYLGLEFQALKNSLPFPYDLERIIDDWVLLGFLVGNDFIPHVPSLHINESALDTLYKIYIEVLPTLGGYINEAGVLNMKRFETYLLRLAELDFDRFREIEGDLAYFASKSSNKKLRRSLEAVNDEETTNDEPMIMTTNDELMNMINSTKNALCNSEEEKMQWDNPNTDADLLDEFKNYKAEYYMEKMKFPEVTEDVLRCQAECYIRAIQWNLHYYYHGVPSWSWYYPYHYAPFISDVKDFSHLDQIDFDLGLPFQPYQQLLGVLPPGSRKILPEAFRNLMVSPESPILNFYPEDFQTDLNGKQHDWEAIVLLPFIDQAVLTEAMEPFYKNLTPDEKRRNEFGPMTVYEYVSQDLGSYQAPEFFPPVKPNHAKETLVSLKEIKVPREKLIPGLLPGAKDSYWYGFPTLKNIPFKGKLVDAKVHVFQQPSRGLNMMLYIQRGYNTNGSGSGNEPINLQKIAEKYVGEEIYVGWPHLVKAFVTSVSTVEEKYVITGAGEIKVTDVLKDDIYHWSLYATELNMKHRNNLGIDTGDVHVIVFAKPFIGSKYKFNEEGIATKVPVWSPQANPYALQTILSDVEVLPCEKLCGGELDVKPLEEIFPVGQIVYLLNSQFYGDEATVIECVERGNVKVEVQIKPEPNIDSIKQAEESSGEQYFTASAAANMCGLHQTNLLARITGTILVQTSDKDPTAKVNIGLNMKYNKSNQELVGYTKKVDGRFWNYSKKAIEVIHEYTTKFPEVFEYLCSHNEDVYKRTDFFKDDADNKVLEITKWIGAQPYTKAERRSINSEILSEAVVRELEKVVSSKDWATENTSVVNVKPDELKLPISHVNLMEPDPQANHQLLDRIVNIRECHPIPLGVKGYIIGIEKRENEQATLYDILFDVPLIGGFRLYTEEKRCYRLTRHGFINLSYGRNLRPNVQSNKPKVRNWRTSSPKKNEVEKCNWRLHGSKADPNDNNSSSKAAATAPTQTDTQLSRMESNLRPDYSSGSNNVTKFFSAYRSPSYNNSQQGQFNFGNNQQQSPNRQVVAPGVGGFHQQPNANSEFQAMWNHLQHQKVPSESMTLPQPNTPTTPPSKLTSAASEQTNALRKILKLRDTVNNSQPASATTIGSNNNSGISLLQQAQPSPPQQHLAAIRTDHHNVIGVRSPPQNPRSCSHSLSCCAALINYCQRTACAYPIYSYVTDNATKVSAVISFPDGMQFKGMPAKDKPNAAESAACLTLTSLTEGKQIMQGRQLFKLAGTGQVQTPQQFHQQAMARLTNQITNLPSPPNQWCQQVKRDNWRFQDPSFQGKVLPVSANNFIPLQAQVPRVQNHSNKNATNTIEVVKPTAQQQQSIVAALWEEMDSKLKTSDHQGSGGKVGGLISLDNHKTSSDTIEIINSDKTKAEVNRDRNRVIAPPAAFIADSKCTASGGSVGAGDAGAGDAAGATTQVHKPKPQRTKSRLAARFSGPIAKD